MPLEEFWYGEAELFFAYRSAYLIKLDEEIERANTVAWLSGAYTLRALWEVHSHLNLKENEKHLAIKYFDKPIDLFASNKDEEKSVIIDKKKEQENQIRAMLTNAEIAIKRNKRKKQKKGKE